MVLYFDEGDLLLKSGGPLHGDSHKISKDLRKGQLKCDGTRAENRFRLSEKRTSPFKSAGRRQSLWNSKVHYGVHSDLFSFTKPATCTKHRQNSAVLCPAMLRHYSAIFRDFSHSGTNFPYSLKMAH